MNHEGLHCFLAVKVCALFSLVSYSSFFLISFITTLFFGYSSFSPLLNYISDLSLPQYSPLPFLYDVGCVISGVLTIPITFYIQKTTLHRRNVEKIEPRGKRGFKILARAGFVAGLLGDISFIGVGIFSLHRNPFGIHYVFAYLLFFGYSLTALIIGLLILLYQTNLSRLMGLSGVIYPLGIFVMFLIFLAFAPPFLVLYEWVVSLSLTAWLFVFTLYFLYTEALYKP